MNSTAAQLIFAGLSLIFTNSRQSEERPSRQHAVSRTTIQRAGAAEQGALNRIQVNLILCVVLQVFWI